MMAADPLDQLVWSALTGRHARFAVGEGLALRYDPAIGVFAAMADRSPASLAALGQLVAAHGDVALLEAGAPPPVPGTRILSAATGVQMVCDRLAGGAEHPFAIEPLGDADAPAMLALATLTQPGPFLARTHLLGDFIGVKLDGQLVAMAGERLKPDGFTEVSGVCTHPDHRGRGHAAALIRQVATRILDRGETPFLHAYASNTGAIGLYRTIGFTLRREVVMTFLTRAQGDVPGS
jgi:predicted GNAT family acetyltransferase